VRGAKKDLLLLLLLEEEESESLVKSITIFFLDFRIGLLLLSNLPSLLFLFIVKSRESVSLIKLSVKS
jgi:hypothetical protein